MPEDLSIIASRRNAALSKKLPVWQLTDDSYTGGQVYQDAKYLWQNPKESDKFYSRRCERAIYLNEIAPLVDMLVGFLYSGNVDRKGIETVNYLIDNAGRKKSFEEFIKTVASRSLLYTSLVLVDSPSFNPDEIKTVRDRIDKSINPYCVLYRPFQIRDFCFDESGNLSWLLLDNSTIDSSDPMAETTTKMVYRLWTPGYFQDFTIDTKNGATTVIPGEEIAHPVGYVPARFVSMKDDDNDFVTDSFFEDIAILSRGLYNKVSLLDEMIESGTFKMLAYPSADGKIPAELEKGGIGPLSVIPYDGSLSHEPNFIGARLEDVSSFLAAINFYLMEILKKFGMDTDEAKQLVQSGKAKKLNFEKVKALLVSACRSLESTEKWIFETAGKWEGKTVSAEITYSKEFLGDDLDEKLSRYATLLTLPYQQLKKTTHRLMAAAAIGDDIDQDEWEAIADEIETYEPPTLDINDLAQTQKDQNTADEESKNTAKTNEGATNETA